MPANLSQPYLRAERAFRAAESLEEQLACLQVMLRELPKHKGTDKLHAGLKQRISRTKKLLQSEKASQRASETLPRQGAGRVVLIGGPNAGKSQLLRSLTRAQPEVADYPYTTRRPTIGMMPFEDISIQLIDTPPLTSETRNPATLELIRGAELVLLVVDLGADDGVDYALDVWQMLSVSKTRLADSSYLSESDIGVSFTAAISVLNKSDDSEFARRREAYAEFCDFALPEVEISAANGDGLDRLRDEMFRRLNILRVYTRPPGGKEADLTDPLTLRGGDTMRDVAAEIHEDLAKRFRFAKVWSGGEGPVVAKAEDPVRDGDIVEIHTD